MALCFAMRCWVYTAESESGQILYVGISHQPKCRIKQHKLKSGWFNRAAKITQQAFNNRYEAMDEERRLILKHKPPFNVSQNPDFKKRANKYKRQTGADKNNQA